MRKRSKETARRRAHRQKVKSRKNTFLQRTLIFLSVIVIAFIVVFAAHRDDGNKSAGNNAVASRDFSQISADVPVYVLLVGIDDEKPAQCNFVGVVAVNKEKKHVDVIMLPDNTKIEGRKEKGAQTLSSIYGEGGISLVQAVVEDIFHVPISHHIIVEADSFLKLMDMTDGMNMYVEKNMYHADRNGNTDINLFQGYQHLDGLEALGYMRYLDSDGTLSRTQRQLRFIKLFLTARLKQRGVINAVEIYRVWNNLDSDIPAKEAARLVYDFGGTDISAVSFYILPGEPSGIREDTGDSPRTYWVYDPIEVQKIIGMTNNALAPDVTTVPERPETANAGDPGKKDTKSASKNVVTDTAKKAAKKQ